MEIIKDLIKCSSCSSILMHPVFLPCGHSICKHHEEQVIKDCYDDIYCGTCDKSYKIPEDGLPPNRTIESLLSKKLECIELEKEHLKALEKCDIFASLLDQFKILENPDLLVHNTISELRNKIDLRREELKQKIDEEAMKLMDKLDEYESKCISAISLVSIDNIRSITTKCETNLKNWREQLQTFEKDVTKWEKISSELENELKELEVNDKFWKTFIYSNELNDFQDIQLLLDKQLESKFHCSNKMETGNRDITLELDNLSKIKASNDTFEYFSESLSALGIDFQVGVRISRQQDNRQYIGVFLFANANEEIRTCDIFVDHDVFVINRFDEKRSSVKNVVATFTNHDGISDLTSLLLDSIMANDSYYDPENDSFTIKVVINYVGFINQEPKMYPYPPMFVHIRWPKQI